MLPSSRVEVQERHLDLMLGCGRHLEEPPPVTAHELRCYPTTGGFRHIEPGLERRVEVGDDGRQQVPRPTTPPRVADLLSKVGVEAVDEGMGSGHNRLTFAVRAVVTSGR